LDTIQKIWAPPRKLFCPPGVISWLRALDVYCCTVGNSQGKPINQVGNISPLWQWQPYSLTKLHATFVICLSGNPFYPTWTWC